jgi:hypothetical protein
VLEASTWHSYDRYLRLHVIPFIGAVALQQLSPVDLNRLWSQAAAAALTSTSPRWPRKQLK